jgi:hypothetical protein
MMWSKAAAFFDLVKRRLVVGAALKAGYINDVETIGGRDTMVGWNATGKLVVAG